jgi:hypothetical protein
VPTIATTMHITWPLLSPHKCISVKPFSHHPPLGLECMNQRLVWNFEINPRPLLDSSRLLPEEGELWRSEMRFFWKKDEIITLHGLSDEFLNLSLYKIKERLDRYYLIPGQDYNIKQRKGELLFKALMQKNHLSCEFGKKIRLSDCPEDEVLPGVDPISAKELQELVDSTGLEVPVKKVALIYKFEDLEPTIKLELARLIIEEKTYYTACVEGYSPKLVTAIGQHLFQNASVASTDYVSFLKKILRLHD